MIGLGFSLQPQYSLPMENVIALLADAGFSAVSPVWTAEPELERIAACAPRHGMTIQSLHAPHKDIARLWEPDAPDSREAQTDIFRCVEACARFRIPVMVLHCWQGLHYTFPEEPLDFRFFDALAEWAHKLGVSIALENLEGEEYLAALMARYQKLPHIGFCFDSGHDHCYPHKLDFLAQFGPRLLMTHLNDNLGLRDPSGIPSGDDDLHYLPFDGNLPWEPCLGRLSQAPRQATLNFEFKTRSHSKDPRDLIYASLSPEAFIQSAAQRARRIADIYEKMLLENAQHKEGTGCTDAAQRCTEEPV